LSLLLSLAGNDVAKIVYRFDSKPGLFSERARLKRRLRVVYRNGSHPPAF
jgi:hypothetical protein